MATAHDFYRDTPNEPADPGNLIASLAADLAAQYRTDPAKCREAEQWVAGTLDSDHYAELALTLHRLHHTAPSELAGTGLLTRLYRLAEVQADALDAQLLSMATAELQRQVDEAEEERSETVGWAHGRAA